MIKKQKIVHTRDEKVLERFEIISYQDTKSTLYFKIGGKIDSYYLMISKYYDIECNFSLPNNKEFKLIERNNNEFYIIKCKKNRNKRFQLTINSVNKNKIVGAKKIIFWFKKGSTINSEYKKKKINILKVHCAP